MKHFVSAYPAVNRQDVQSQTDGIGGRSLLNEEDIVDVHLHEWLVSAAVRNTDLTVSTDQGINIATNSLVGMTSYELLQRRAWKCLVARLLHATVAKSAE